MKKKWIRYLHNGVMGLLIAAGIAGGVFFVGRVRGWFPSQEEPAVTLSLMAKELTGTVLIQRDGISYQLKEDDSLKMGDQVTIKEHGTAVLCGSDSKVYCGEGSALLVGAGTEGALQLTLTQGELFGHCNGGESLRLMVGNQSALLKKGTAALVVTEKQLTLDVFSGSVTFTSGDLGAVAAASGNRLQVRCADGRWEIPMLQTLALCDLSDFALGCGEGYDDLCVTGVQIQKEIQRREEKVQAALEAKLKAKDDGEAVKQVKEAGAVKKAESSEAAAETETSSENEETNDETECAQKEKKPKAEEKTELVKKKPEKQSDAESEKEQSDEKQEETTTESGGSCTIRIECTTLLDNIDDLKESKRSYVPSNGVILKKTKVSFTEGETVYDVLTRTCEKAGIQLEVSYSGGYGSYYVEGIGNLYEFDCGRQSGWVYTLNGASSNYGCSSYVLKDGEHIEWSYTCKGLGSDAT